MLNLGFLINPLAGIGGAVALKGSDGADTVAEALRRGAQPQASQRCRQALDLLLPYRDELHFYTAAGAMGAELLQAMGFAHTVVFSPGDASQTTAADTEAAVAALRARELGLLIFAGGDGTARNVCAVVGEDMPVLGIPAGVKIHSAVYAVSPAAAGRIIEELLTGSALELTTAKVMDLDEAAYRAGNVRAKLFGYMSVPAHALVQQSKNSLRAAEPETISQIADYVADTLEPGVLYVLGSGSTCAAIKERLGMEVSLLGVDAFLFKGSLCQGAQSRQVLCDGTEAQLWALLQEHTQVRLLLTLIGGQGHVFGRGNQQLSPRILRHIGRRHIQVVASPGKLQSLHQRPLLIDSGDSQLDREFAGPIRVITGYDAIAIYPLSCA